MKNEYLNTKGRLNLVHQAKLISLLYSFQEQIKNQSGDMKPLLETLKKDLFDINPFEGPTIQWVEYSDWVMEHIEGYEYGDTHLLNHTTSPLLMGFHPEDYDESYELPTTIRKKAKFIGYKLRIKYPGCNHEVGHFEPRTTGEFSNYPEIWEPVYSPKDLFYIGKVENRPEGLVQYRERKKLETKSQPESRDTQLRDKIAIKIMVKQINLVKGTNPWESETIKKYMEGCYIIADKIINNIQK
jgi:hypothetical protein